MDMSSGELIRSMSVRIGLSSANKKSPVPTKAGGYFQLGIDQTV